MEINVPILIWGIVTTALGVGFLIRNNAVYKYRQRVLKKMHDRNMKDIEEGREWMSRYELWKAVSYDSMVYKFWRPLDSFFDEEAMFKPSPKERP